MARLAPMLAFALTCAAAARSRDIEEVRVAPGNVGTMVSGSITGQAYARTGSAPAPVRRCAPRSPLPRSLSPRPTAQKRGISTSFRPAATGRDLHRRDGRGQFGDRAGARGRGLYDPCLADRQRRGCRQVGERQSRSADPVAGPGCQSWVSVRKPRYPNRAASARKLRLRYFHFPRQALTIIAKINMCSAIETPMANV